MFTQTRMSGKDIIENIGFRTNHGDGKSWREGKLVSKNMI
jgi:hypothetical protein